MAFLGKTPWGAARGGAAVQDRDVLFLALLLAATAPASGHPAAFSQSGAVPQEINVSVCALSVVEWADVAMLALEQS